MACEGCSRAEKEREEYSRFLSILIKRYKESPESFSIDCIDDMQCSFPASMQKAKHEFRCKYPSAVQ